MKTEEDPVTEVKGSTSFTVKVEPLEETILPLLDYANKHNDVNAALELIKVEALILEQNRLREAEPCVDCKIEQSEDQNVGVIEGQSVEVKTEDQTAEVGVIKEEKMEFCFDSKLEKVELENLTVESGVSGGQDPSIANQNVYQYADSTDSEVQGDGSEECPVSESNVVVTKVAEDDRGCSNGNRVVTMGHVKHFRKPGYWPSGGEVWGFAIGTKPVDGCHNCTASQKRTFGRKISKLLAKLKVDKEGRIDTDEELFSVEGCSCPAVAAGAKGKRPQRKPYAQCSAKGKQKKAYKFWLDAKRRMKEDAATDNVEIPMSAIIEAMLKDPEEGTAKLYSNTAHR